MNDVLKPSCPDFDRVQEKENKQKHKLLPNGTQAHTAWVSFDVTNKRADNDTPNRSKHDAYRKKIFSLSNLFRSVTFRSEIHIERSSRYGDLIYGNSG